MMKRKSRMLRLSALMLALLTLLLSLSACGGEPEEIVTEDGTEEATDAPSADANELILAAGGGAAYRILYPLLGNELISDAMRQLKEGLESLSGAKFTAMSDTLADGKTDLEILLGGTSRAESGAAIGALRENSYSVTVSGNRVVIAASNDGLYGEAVKALLKGCEWKNGVLTLKKDFKAESGSIVLAELAKGGESPYRIVYQRSSAEALSIAERVQKLIKSTTGIELAIVTDSGSSLANYEILVGETDRRFSRENPVYFMNYGVLFQKERRTIALSGNLEEAYAKLESYVKVLGRQGELAIPEAVFGRFTMDGYADVPAFREKKYDSLLVGEMNSFHAVYKNATREESLSYLSSLAEKGYQTRLSKEVNGNVFATLENGDSILSFTFEASVSVARVAAEKKGRVTLAPTEAQDYEKLTTPQITQINGNCSFLIRLSDGRFLVLDGGLNRTENVDGLMQAMEEQNVRGGKPVIACWYLSHPHSDHYGGFIGFSDKYSSRITLERISFNLPSIDVYGQNTEKEGTTSDIEMIIKKTLDVIRVRYASAAISIPHSGQEMFFADARVEVMYTYEDRSAATMTVTNSSSVVIFVNLAGQRIALLADAHDDTCEILARMYGDTLKLDIVQISHHGYNGGNKTMYQKMNAAVALWTSPFSTVKKEGLWNNPRNHFDMAWVQENLMMEKGAMVLPLPYQVGSLPDYARTKADFS